MKKRGNNKKSITTFNLKKEYGKSFDYIKDSKNFIFVVIAVFFVFSFIGFFIPVPDVITEKIFEFIKQLLEQTKDKGWFWDTEITARAHYNKLKIKTLPTLFIRKPYKTSTVNIISDSLGYFKKLLKFRKETKRIMRK